MNIDRDGHIKVRDISFSLLTEGKNLKVSADGFSMYPSIKPGSIIIIEPIADDLFPIPGEIIAWKRESGFVVHRLVSIMKTKESTLFITRGDSCAREDQPFPMERIAGRVISVENSEGRILCSGTNLIRKPSYLYNRLLAWLMVRIRKYL